jgi:methyl-accepting chemotaxis protein
MFESPRNKKTADIVWAGPVFAIVSFCIVRIFAIDGQRLAISLEISTSLTIVFVIYCLFSTTMQNRQERTRDAVALKWASEGRVLAENHDKLATLLATIPPDIFRTLDVHSDTELVETLIADAVLQGEKSRTTAKNQGKVKSLIGSTPRMTELLAAHLAESNNTTETATIAIIRKITEVKEEAGRLVAQLEQTRERVSFLHNDAQTKIEETSLLLEGLTQYQLQLDREIKSSIQSISAQIGELKASTSIIQDVNAMTNVLAINAAIEAARAGKAGLGFAVVSGEVRKLSKEVESAATDIERKISVVSLTVNEAMESIAELTRGEDEGQWISKIAFALPRLSKNFSSTVAELDGYVENTNAAVHGMLDAIVEALAQAQFQDITRQQIEQVQKGLALLGQHLNEVGAIMERDLSQPIDIMPFREVTDSMESNYTMMVQYKIHHETLGGTLPEAELKQPSIELF